MQPNRLERCWDGVKAEILGKWDKLSEYDLKDVGGDFDRLVEKIRLCYEPDRSKLSIEASIRDWLVLKISELENRQYSR